MEISRVPGIVEAQFDEVRVLLNEDLEYLGIDEVGQRIWAMLDRPRTLEEVVASLTEEYDVSEDECTRDVTEFVEALARHGLVSVA